MNKDSVCWPSNATLLKDTKWGSLKKLQRIKKELIDLEVIQVEARVNGAGQSANIYRITTDKVNVYAGDPKRVRGVTQNGSGGVGQNDTGGVTQNGSGPLGQNGSTEVLSSEVLINEVLTNTNTPDSGESTVSAKELKKEKVDAIYSFDQFWDDYGKKNDKKKCQKKYYSLALKDIKRIKETLLNYIKATPEVQYRKNPYTYLNAETWNDEQYQIQAKRATNPDKPVYRMRKREAPKPTPPPPTPEEWAMIEAHAKKLGYGSKLEKESKEDKNKQTSQRPKSGLARANERLRQARQAARERAFEGWVA